MLYLCIVFLCVCMLISTEPCSRFLKSNFYKIYPSKFLFRYSCFCTTVTDCSRVLIETLLVALHMKKFSTFYVPQIFVIIFARSFIQTFQINPGHTLASYFFKINFNIFLSHYNGLSLEAVWPKILYSFLMSARHAASSPHLNPASNV